MGRTYKRNDPYRSNRPKSLKEKRNQSQSNRRGYADDNSADFSTGKHKRRNPDDYTTRDDWQ